MKIHIVSRCSIAITKIAIIEGQRSYPCCAQNGRNRRDIRPFFQTALTVRHDDDRMRAIAFRQLQNTSEGMRSEEHTSELQSLMRISYAVFCLKKKMNQHTTNNTSSNINT